MYFHHTKYARSTIFSHVPVYLLQVSIVVVVAYTGKYRFALYIKIEVMCGMYVWYVMLPLVLLVCCSCYWIVGLLGRTCMLLQTCDKDHALHCSIVRTMYTIVTDVAQIWTADPLMMWFSPPRGSIGDTFRNVWDISVVRKGETTSFCVTTGNKSCYPLSNPVTFALRCCRSLIRTAKMLLQLQIYDVVSNGFVPRPDGTYFKGFCFVTATYGAFVCACVGAILNTSWENFIPLFHQLSKAHAQHIKRWYNSSSSGET